MPNLLLAGYIGCGNLGDDAIMLGLVEGLKNSNYSFTVMSGSPEETYRQHGIPSFQRTDGKALDEAISKCDALVFPGGSIFQDATSVRSVGYYSNLIKKAKSAGKKVVMLGQGIGPLDSFFGKKMAATAFNMVDAIAVRDPQSATTLKALGVKHTPRITGDLAFLMPDAVNPADQNNFNVGGMRMIGVSVKSHGKLDVVSIFGDFCRLIFQSGQMPVLLEMDRNEDGPLIDKIEKQQGGKIPDIKKLASPVQVQQRVIRMDAMVATRLHAGILATTVGVPSLMVSYDPKVAAFARSLDLGATVTLDSQLTGARLYEVFQSFIKNRDRNIKIVEKKRVEFAQAALLNIEILRGIVK